MFQTDIDLAPLNTFGIPAKGRLYAEYKDTRELLRIYRSDEYREHEVLHIGGGSNLLFVGDFSGLILHSGIKGMTLYRKNEKYAFAICGAGEKWTDFVDWTIEQGLSGLENMAGIPGEVGAAPVQNVGAYGGEAGDFIHSVECFDTHNGKTVTLKGADCGFAYRDSNFKGIWKGRYYVLRVSFRLRISEEASNPEYGSLKNMAEKLGRRPTTREVADKVLELRNSKLPDPAFVGSAGSFFKNPVVNGYWFREEVLCLHPEVPYYELPDGKVKIPAGWLIEHSGLKGYRIGGAEVWPNQCLVLANTGGATAEDVMRLAEHVRRKVGNMYNVHLEPEVNYIDTSMTVTVLGSGTSKGVPEIGCDCPVCRSEDPRDNRLRASVLIQVSGLNILIDPSQDFRQQMLHHDIHRIDAILITHSHYDHVGGLDDVRPLCADGKIRLYMAKDVNADLHRRLDYCFSEHPYPGVPKFNITEISTLPFELDGVNILPIRVMHGELPILGYRIGNFAYVTDAKTIPEEEMWKLEGLEVLILNALRDKPHFSHLSVSEALKIIEEVKPGRTYLTHICHNMGLHEERNASLPPSVELAYDGLVIRL